MGGMIGGNELARNEREKEKKKNCEIERMDG